MADLPTPAPRLENETDVRRRMDKIRAHYEPFTRDLNPSKPVRRSGEPLNPWRFRYTEGGPAGGDAWQEVSLPEYKGRTAWVGEYVTTFSLPSQLIDSPRLLLQFDGVETILKARLNDIEIGSHSGGSDPFTLDITESVDRIGTNELCLEVTNGLCVNGTGYQRVFSREPYRTGNTPYKLVGEWGNMNGRAGYAGGVWRDVRILGTADSWIAGVLIHPDPDSSQVALQIECESKPRFTGRVRVEIVPRNFAGTAAEVTTEIDVPGHGASVVEAAVDLSDQHWWSPDEPYLYTARVSLLPRHPDGSRSTSDSPVDMLEYGFGQRTFRWDDSIKRYRLNGVPYRFRGTTTINSLNMAYVRGDIGFLVDQILLAKAAGFTMFRHHIMSPIQEINDYLDAYGMLSQPEMPIWGRFHPDLIAPALEQLPRIARQHYNHPSTVLFTISSESAMERESYAEYQPQAIELMEREFPRLEWKIEGVRGNLSGIPGERAEWGNLLEYKSDLYDAHEYPGWYVNYGSLEPVRDGETLMSIGEFGPESLSNLSTMKATWPDGARPRDPLEEVSRDELPFGPQYSWEQSRWFLPTPATLDGWIDQTQRHSAAVHRYQTSIYRRSPSVIGYHQYFLNEPVWNTWRKTICGVDLSPKLPYYAMARSNAPVLIDLFLEQEHFVPGDAVPVRLFVANDSLSEIEGGEVQLFLIDPDGGVVWSHTVSVDALPAAPVEVDLPALGLSDTTPEGEYVLRAFLINDGVTLSDDEATISVIGTNWPVKAPAIPSGAMPVLHFAGSDASVAVARHLHDQLGDGYRQLSMEAFSDTDLAASLVVIDGVAEWDGLPTERITDHLLGGGRVLLRELEPGDLGWLVDGLSVVADPSRALFRPDEQHPLFCSREGAGGDSEAVKGEARYLTAADFALWNFTPTTRPFSRNQVMPYAAKRTRDIVECSVRFKGKEFNRTAHISKDNTIRMLSVADADRDAVALLEIEYGPGRVLICQAGVYRRYHQHPVARGLIHREIEYLLSPPEQLIREKFDTIFRF